MCNAVSITFEYLCVLDEVVLATLGDVGIVTPIQMVNIRFNG